MTILQVADLGFGYGASKLFEGVTFSLALGERVALVAPNGAGKSTLLRLITSELAADQGQAVVRRGATVAYYRQSHELSAEGTVLDAFLSGFQNVLALRHALDQAQHAAASGTKEDLDCLARASDEYHLAHGDELERKVEIIAGKLGFRAEDMSRVVESLSGGERGRLHLGVVLARDPDLLLLDEPTNHLDLDTIGWLEQHLASSRSGVIVVSHDRAFLDNVTGATMELGRKSFRVYPLRYSDYAVAREADLERERELAERQQAFVDKTEDFIRKNIAGQKTKQAQSRRKMLEKLDRLENPEDVWAVAEKVRFRFAPAPRTGDIVLEAKGLGAARGGRTLFDGLDLLVRRGDRIGIVGPNGAGKTTLLRMLAARGGPDDHGDVRRGTNLEEGYFDQHLGSLDVTRTAVEEIRSIRGDLNVDGARSYLARFRFYGDDPLRKVSGYSGGERSRLSLAKLLLEPRNLLFLDEPTNHLDIPAAEILEEALVGFEGTVVLVSHDRRFLENVTTRTVSIRDGACDVYPGGFRDFVDAAKKRAAAEGAAAAGKSDKRKPKAVPTPSPEEERAARRVAFEQERADARAVERKRKRIAELEDLIAGAEVKVGALREQLKEDPAGNWEKIANLAREEQALSRRIESMMSEWSTLSEQLAKDGKQGGKARMMERVRWIKGRTGSLCVLVVAAITFGSGCRRRATDELAQMAEQETKPLPTLSITDDTADLLLTWIDSRGDAHVASKPADIPPEGRDHVRVVVTTKEDGTRGLFYVANLAAKNPDGSYAVSSMPRADWDGLIAQRRQALAASSATENAPDEPPAAKDPAHPSPGSFTVIVYGASWCGACHQAIAYLKSRKIPAIEKDIERDPAAESEMQAKLARAGMHGGSIPVIDVKGNILIGFEPNALEAAVRRATAAVTL